MGFYKYKNTKPYGVSQDRYIKIKSSVFYMDWKNGLMCFQSDNLSRWFGQLLKGKGDSADWLEGNAENFMPLAVHSQP